MTIEDLFKLKVANIIYSIVLICKTIYSYEWQINIF